MPPLKYKDRNPNQTKRKKRKSEKREAIQQKNTTIIILLSSEKILCLGIRVSYEKGTVRKQNDIGNLKFESRNYNK